MLRHTFLHVPGIGYATEQKLWAQGFLSWEDYFDKCQYCSLPLPIRDKLAENLEESVRALNAEHARHFEVRLPPAEMWRLYSEFNEKVAFLDIETTGLYPGADVITLIGLFDGQRTKVFIRGVNLQEFAQEVRKYSLIVTFNGKRFDIPFIRRTLGELPDYQAHIDLLYPLRKLGYRGGLKSIEVQLGLEREGALKGVDGFLAILLWREYQWGNRAALDTLVRYNLEDAVNLQYLTDIVYNEALTRLPIRVEPLPVHPKYAVDTPFDPDLIHHLKRLTAAMLPYP
ncbi:ribonuclease H-like domain-containing protein [Chloroflexota bacterium]